MTQFTLFLSRLVEQLGSEKAAQFVREFSGKTIQFPVTDHYDTKPRDDFGFPVNVPIIGETVQRPVTKRLTVFVNGVEYDVSRLPEAAVGDVISVNPACLTPLDPDRFAFGSRPLHVSSHDEETNQTAPDLQAQSLDHAQPSLGRLDEEANARLHASEPEAAVNQAPHGAQASQPTPETQSEVRSIDPANVDRS
ncbi:hypothetical protein CBP51_16910 [Cellvibrio mixtus]|uniref:Uncharacterized protein n=1 Tax=Cellvibrio mixtus TaxID=39650 RepID=A0A266Q638_9GAMM|nr:hypothetical protein [Cellvibrio mixtus]OZY84841.1 hypothetical protein CBP51_16910 [Cellvibrio mixtus]